MRENKDLFFFSIDTKFPQTILHPVNQFCVIYKSFIQIRQFQQNQNSSTTEQQQFSVRCRWIESMHYQNIRRKEHICVLGIFLVVALV